MIIHSNNKITATLTFFSPSHPPQPDRDITAPTGGQQPPIRCKRQPPQKFPQEELSYRTRIALLFIIEGSLGLMTRILQGKLDPVDFLEGHNAINDNIREVLRRYFE